MNELFRSQDPVLDIHNRWIPILESHPELRSRLCTPMLKEDETSLPPDEANHDDRGNDDDENGGSDDVGDEAS